VRNPSPSIGEPATSVEQHLAARETEAFASTNEGQADALYAPYLERQKREWQDVERGRKVRLPDSLDFRSIPGLSNEMVERLSLARPADLDQASRIPGMTPAGLTALYVATSREAA
jgi:tRNA uridine 5-carboxymethylaminomethyl modification enzyme